MSTKKNIGFLLLLGFARLSYQLCTDVVEQEPGTYYYYSTNYPQKDNINMCRQKLVVPQDHKIVAECNIDIDENDDGTCDMTLLISKDGDLNMRNDSYTFCGHGQANLASNANSMAFGYESTQAATTSEGRFLCKLSVLPAEPSCECGWSRSTRIVSGSDAEVGEFPSIAGLIRYSERDIFCGGTIISNRLIVTAKHCVENENVDTFAIAVGFVNRTGSIGRTYRIANIHMPPDTIDGRNDIALLQTTVDMEFSYAVGPACLPRMQEGHQFIGKEVTLAGWGATEYRGSQSDVLQKVNVFVVPNYECQFNYNELEATNFCTYAPEKDACQFDSGGPVYLQQARQFLIGVISYGNRCAELEGVHTNITPYLGWIQYVANNEQLCFKEFK